MGSFTDRESFERFVFNVKTKLKRGERIPLLSSLRMKKNVHQERPLNDEEFGFLVKNVFQNFESASEIDLSGNPFTVLQLKILAEHLAAGNLPNLTTIIMDSRESLPTVENYEKTKKEHERVILRAQEVTQNIMKHLAGTRLASLINPSNFRKVKKPRRSSDNDDKFEFPSSALIRKTIQAEIQRLNKILEEPRKNLTPQEIVLFKQQLDSLNNFLSGVALIKKSLEELETLQSREYVLQASLYHQEKEYHKVLGFYEGIQSSLAENQKKQEALQADYRHERALDFERSEREFKALDDVAKAQRLAQLALRKTGESSYKNFKETAQKLNTLPANDPKIQLTLELARYLDRKIRERKKKSDFSKNYGITFGMSPRDLDSKIDLAYEALGILNRNPAPSNAEMVEALKKLHFQNRENVSNSDSFFHRNLGLQGDISDIFMKHKSIFEESFKQPTKLSKSQGSKGDVQNNTNKIFKKSLSNTPNTTAPQKNISKEKSIPKEIQSIGSEMIERAEFVATAANELNQKFAAPAEMDNREAGSEAQDNASFYLSKEMPNEISGLSPILRNVEKELNKYVSDASAKLSGLVSSPLFYATVSANKKRAEGMLDILSEKDPLVQRQKIENFGVNMDAFKASIQRNNPNYPLPALVRNFDILRDELIKETVVQDFQEKDKPKR